MAQYDSENEDQPRKVVDIHGDFTLLDVEPPLMLKLDQINEIARLYGPGRVVALRPIPDVQSVARAKQLMGNGDDAVWTGTVFEAPAELSPQFVFPMRSINTLQTRCIDRFAIRRRFSPDVSDLKTMAAFTDGACAPNGLDMSRGGFAFVFNETSQGVQSRALEVKGPTGEVLTHTSNRAELRAVIAFLRFRSWWGEGWKRIVVITDSEYVAKGATTWLRTWAGNGWHTAAGNRDLWETLSDTLGMYAAGGCEVSFWMVPRRWNTVADAAAKDACRLESDQDYSNDTGVAI